MTPESEPGLESRLVGWKRIANYLGCGERTARRWERLEQLPVHRQHHEKRSTVYALPHELDAWVESRSAPEAGQSHRATTSSRLPVAMLLALGALLIGVATTWLLQDSKSVAPELTDSRTDPIAVELYERGRMLWSQRGDVPNQRAIKLLTQAVERDDTFAEAWAALASAWLTLPTYTDKYSPEHAINEALLAAGRAVSLDPTLVEPRSVMATVAKAQGDWLESERIFQEALAADPDNTSVLLWFAGNYRELGMMEAAGELTLRARELDPHSPPILTEVAMNLHQVGRSQDGRELLDYLWFDLGVETPVVWVGQWFSMIEAGELDSAAQWIDKSPFRPFRAEFEAFIERKRVPSTDSAAFSDLIIAAYERGLPGWLAFHMLDQSGLPDSALDIFERDSEDGEFDTSVVLFYERGGTARAETRFADLIERLGYYEYWRDRGAPDLCKREPQIPLCRRINDSVSERG